MRTKDVAKAHATAYQDRAEEFFQAMKDEEEFERYHAATLLGIHASIALTDAITVAVLGKRSTDEQHASVAKLLRQAAHLDKVEDAKGINRLERILATKNYVAYGEDFHSGDPDKKLQAVCNQVSRFFAWAYEHFHAIQRKGN